MYTYSINNMSKNSNSPVANPNPSILTSSVPLVPTPPSPTPTSTLGQTTPQIKEELKRNPLQYYVKASFQITYILLLTTATITFIEAICTKVPAVRHILNLETCISIVAGYFYSVFLAQIDGYVKDDKKVDWTDITKTRYIDWSITTPLMLLTLCIVLGSNTNQKVGIFTLAAIVILNYIMLIIGYLGETKVLNRLTADIGGFIPFIAMFYIIFLKFVEPKYVFSNYLLFWFYVLIWGLYGVVYLFNESYKNIIMNILDCFAKCFIGLGLWLYYTRATFVEKF